MSVVLWKMPLMLLPTVNLRRFLCSDICFSVKICSLIQMWTNMLAHLVKSFKNPSSKSKFCCSDITSQLKIIIIKLTLNF